MLYREETTEALNYNRSSGRLLNTCSTLLENKFQLVRCSWGSCLIEGPQVPSVPRQLQEKYVFVYLKCFHAVFWWAVRKLNIKKRMTQVVKTVYNNNAKSKIRVSTSYSQPLNVTVSFHEESLLSPPLFIIVIKGLLYEIRVGFSSEMLLKFC